MSLNPFILQEQLTLILDPGNPRFTGFERDLQACVERFVTAFDTYAIQATDVSDDALVRGNQDAMRVVLRSGLVLQNNGRAAALVFAHAFAAYWQGAPFATDKLVEPLHPKTTGGNRIFLNETSSRVIGVDTEPYVEFLVPELRVLSGGVTKMQRLARAIHEATIVSVLVQIDGLDTTMMPGPLPVQNVDYVR